MNRYFAFSFLRFFGKYAQESEKKDIYLKYFYAPMLFLGFG
jgi:hypothetical protein